MYIVNNPSIAVDYHIADNVLCISNSLNLTLLLITVFIESNQVSVLQIQRSCSSFLNIVPFIISFRRNRRICINAHDNWIREYALWDIAWCGVLKVKQQIIWLMFITFLHQPEQAAAIAKALLTVYMQENLLNKAHSLKWVIFSIGAQI